MGKAVAEEVPAAKDLYDRASNILGYDLYEKVYILSYFYLHIPFQLSRFIFLVSVCQRAQSRLGLHRHLPARYLCVEHGMCGEVESY